MLTVQFAKIGFLDFLKSWRQKNVRRRIIIRQTKVSATYNSENNTLFLTRCSLATEFFYEFFIPFLNPSGGMEIIFYIPSPGTEFLFECLLFGMDFFVWYSCFPGWELKLRPYLQYRVSIYTQFFKRENQEIKFPLLCTKLSKDKHKFLSFKVGSPGVDLLASYAYYVLLVRPIYRPTVPQ